MDNVIDELQIELEASSDSAQQGIDKLVASFHRLDKVGQSAGMKTLYSNLKKIQSLDLSKQSNQLSRICSSLENIAKMRGVLSALDATGNGSAIPQVQQVKTSIPDIKSPITETVERVEESLDSTRNEFQQLSDDGKMAVDLEKSAQAVVELKRKLESAQASLDLMRRKVEALGERYNELREKFGRDNLKTINAEIAFQKASQAANTLEGKVASLWAELVKLQGLSGVQPDVGNVGSRSETDSLFGDFNVPNYENLLGFSSEISAAKSEMTGFKSVLLSLIPVFKKAGEKAKSFFSQLNGKIGFKAGTSAAIKFFSSLKRIAMYRAVRYILSLITTSFKEGLQNVVQYSSSANAVVSELTSKFTQLKNSIGAATIPLLQLIAPALISLMNLAMQAADALNQVFSVLAGNSIYIKANTDYWEDYAKSISNAKNSVAGFDELNKLGDSSTDYDSMFETVELDNAAVEDKFGWIIEIVGKIQNIFDTIKQGIKALKPSLQPFIDVLNIMLDVVSMIAQFFADYIVPAINIISPEIATLLATLAPFLQPVLDIVGSILNILAPIVILLLRIASALIPILQPVLDVVGSILDILTPIVSFLVEIVNMIIPILSPVVDIVSSFLNILVSILKVLTPILNILTPILEILTPIISLILEIANVILPIFTSVFDGIGILLSALVDFFVKGLNVILSTFLTVFGNIINFFKSVFVGDWESAWKSLVNIGIAVLNFIITGFESFVNFFVGAINGITGSLSNLWTWIGIPAIPSIPEVSFGRVDYFAGGGFPATGELFIAREAGAEMVGSIGGHTAVANNDQIVEAIKQGVYEAMQSSESGGDWTIQIVSDGRIKASQVITAAQRKNQRDGKTVIQLG